MPDPQPAYIPSMSFRFSGIAICALLGTLPLEAAPAPVVTLSNVRDLIRQHHPGIFAAQLRIREAVGRSLQAGRLANPELETSLERQPSSNDHRVEIGLSQAFPVTDRLRLEKEVSAAAIHAAEAEVREVERRAVAHAKGIVIEILANQAKQELVRRQASLAAELAGHLTAAADRGEASALDAGQARLARSRLELDERRNAADRIRLLGELRPLIGMATGTSFIVSGTLPQPSVATATVDPTRRPDYQSASIEEEAAARRIALEQARRYEDVEAGLFAARERTEDIPAGYADETLIGLRLKFPLPLWNRNEGAIREAETVRDRKKSERTALATAIRIEADTAAAEMRQWADLLDDIRKTLIPMADEQITLTEQAHRNGQASIKDLLNSRENQLELSSSAIDALREFHLARVRHETALGNP